MLHTHVSQNDICTQFKGTLVILMSHQVKSTSGQLAWLHTVARPTLPASHLCPISYFEKKKCRDLSRESLSPITQHWLWDPSSVTPYTYLLGKRKKVTIRKSFWETVLISRGKFEGGDRVGKHVFAQILFNSSWETTFCSTQSLC